SWWMHRSVAAVMRAGTEGSSVTSTAPPVESPSPLETSTPEPAKAPTSTPTETQTQMSTPTPTPSPTPAPMPANPKQGDIYTEDLGGGLKLDLVYIPDGSFTMGSPENELERNKDEGPQHRVTLRGFWTSKFEITQAQYQAVTGINPSY